MHRPPIVTPPGDVPRGPARAQRGMRRPLLAGLVAIVLVALLVGIVLVFQPGKGDGEGLVNLTIPAGSSTKKIGDALADAGVVDSGLFFAVRAGLSGKGGDLRSGRHELRHDMSYGAAIDALTAAPPAPDRPATVKVTVPEGPSRREIAPIVARTGLRGDYLQASKRFAGALNPFRYGAPRGTRSLEGFLFPATYELPAGAPARALVESQLEAFRDNVAGVDLRSAKRKNLTAYDVLIIASMVEREARVPRERRLIAAVVYNRLKQGIPLGIDATIRFVTNNWSQPLRESELDLESPYNTRKRAGLPPTPIGNPGLASIQAAARPADVDYLYFVVKPGTCGEHAFSSSKDQFDRDAARYNSERERRGGRSPTTC